jgi:hypothetical protein
VWASMAAQERMGKCKSMESTWKPQNEQFQGLARHWLCHHGSLFQHKGLEGPHEVHRVSSIDEGASADM